MNRGKPVVLITGGAKGLGRYMAASLAREGYRIAFSYWRSDKEAVTLTEEIETIGSEALAIRAELTDSQSLTRLVESTEERFGRIDVLINNAGPFIRERRTFSEYSREEMRYMLDSNLTAAMELDWLVLPGMRRRQYGRIIHFGFAHAGESRAWPHRAVYAAAKVGLVSFTKTLAVEEAPHGITVNMICPGDIRGDNKEQPISGVRGQVDPESPRLRPGSGEDVARVVSFLIQPDSDFVTGAVIDVSGGMDPIRIWPLSRK